MRHSFCFTGGFYLLRKRKFRKGTNRKLFRLSVGWLCAEGRGGSAWLQLEEDTKNHHGGTRSNFWSPEEQVWSVSNTIVQSCPFAAFRLAHCPVRMSHTHCVFHQNLGERKLPTPFPSVAHHKALNLAACFQRGSGVTPQVSWAAPSSSSGSVRGIRFRFHCPMRPWPPAPSCALFWLWAPQHHSAARNISIHFQTSSFRRSPLFVFKTHALSPRDHFCFMS